MKKIFINIITIFLSFFMTISFFEVMKWHHIGDTLTAFVLVRFVTFFILLLALLFGIIYFSKNNKKFWKILLILGVSPFVIALIIGIYFAVAGFSGLCLCGEFYGFKAFIESIAMYSYNFYQNYILGIILLVIAVIKLRKV